jgi:hypothetical protein
MSLDDILGPFVGISIENAQEALVGRPRSVRLEREDYRSGQSYNRISIETDYDVDGRVTARSVYRRDGSLSIRESFEYGSDPRLLTVRTSDGQGQVLTIRRTQTSARGEESIVTDALGEIRETTNTTRDSDGRVVLATSVDVVANTEIRMTVDYRLGNAEANITFVRQGSAPTGTKLVLSPEGSLLGSGRELGADKPNGVLTSRRATVQSRDADGNWTRLTIVERDSSTDGDVVSASISRAITYYR